LREVGCFAEVTLGIAMYGIYSQVNVK
jgi:hypothetical protein